MSDMPTIMAEHKARQRDAVESATFGHLAPEDGRVYPGSIVFANGEYGDIVPVLVRFDDLPDSPWFAEGMGQHLFDLVVPKFVDEDRLPHGVYVWRGTYRMTTVPGVQDDEGYCLENPRNDHLFTGTTTRIEVPA